MNPDEGWRRAYTVNEAGGKVLLNEAVEISFSYSSLEEFYALNPNCCELVEVFDGGERRNNTIPFGERVCGRLNTLVRVFYIYDYDQQNGGLPLYREKYFGLSNCGESWTAEEVIRLHKPAW